MHIGIVLMNLGGPTHEDNVRIFLENLFKDEDIIKMGGGKMQHLFAKIKAKFVELFQSSVAIGGKQPDELIGCGTQGDQFCPVTG